MAAAHFRFQYESFKNQFDRILYLFYRLWLVVMNYRCRIVDNKAYRKIQIASLKLNFYHQAIDSVGLHVITWKK